MKKKITAILCAALVLALAAAGAVRLYHDHQLKAMRAEADALVENGEYMQAKSIYELLEDTEQSKRCDELEADRLYREAEMMLEAGDYESAREVLAGLGKSRDTAELLKACDWMEAYYLECIGEIEPAREKYLSLGEDYPGCAEALDRINAKLYDEAMECAYAFDMKEAYRLWTLLGNFRDCEVLSWRGERIIKWAEKSGGKRMTDASRVYTNSYYPYVYADELCYAVTPEKCDRDTRFFVYYPGGMNEELSVDYLLYYLMNPPENTIAVFMRRNRFGDPETETQEMLKCLEQTAAEKGMFVHDVVLCGSSMGAYTAMHSAVYLHNHFFINTRCLMSLDAGLDWSEPTLLLNEDECRETAEMGMDFYLFESPGVGMNRDGIRRLVNAGNNVTLVGCIYDDHERITLDAMGMGVVEWMLGDWQTPCELNIYSFNRLEPDI